MHESKRRVNDHFNSESRWPRPRPDVTARLKPLSRDIWTLSPTVQHVLVTTTGNTSDSAVVGKSRTTPPPTTAGLRNSERARARRRLPRVPSPFAGFETHLCSRIARAAPPPPRAAWPPFIFFAGRRSRSHAGCSSSQPCPPRAHPPASSPKINVRPGVLAPPPPPPDPGAAEANVAFVPRHNRIKPS